MHQQSLEAHPKHLVDIVIRNNHCRKAFFLNKFGIVILIGSSTNGKAVEKNIWCIWGKIFISKSERFLKELITLTFEMHVVHILYAIKYKNLVLTKKSFVKCISSIWFGASTNSEADGSKLISVNVEKLFVNDFQICWWIHQQIKKLEENTLNFSQAVR